jgi:hypothetical protein
MTLFQNLTLFTNHNGNLQEMLEMASFLKYVDLYLMSEWDRFYMGHPVQLMMIINEYKSNSHLSCLSIVRGHSRNLQRSVPPVPSGLSPPIAPSHSSFFPPL